MKRPEVIFCDIDGTLLQNGAHEVAPAVFAEIARLRKLGVRFCPASGRQYASLRRLFARVADELYYICENGTILYGPGNPGEVLYKSVIERELAERLSSEILADPRCEVLISGANVSYLLPKHADYPDLIQNTIGNDTAVVKSLADITEDIIKISIYVPGGTEDLPGVAADYTPEWREHFHVDVAGGQWLDFTQVNKGDGVRHFCERMGISPADAMAFGDNWNDRAMLEAVGMPVIMDTAHEALLEQFNWHCGSVEAVLRTIE